MKFIYQMIEQEDLGHLSESGVDEVILCSKEFSRWGEISVSQIEKIAIELRKLGIRTVFSFDILMTEGLFWHKSEEVKKVDLSLFDAVRVQDAGALFFVLKNTELPIQLILETGNHNSIGVSEWANIVGPRLDRLILSLEWPKEELQKLLSDMPYEFELMGLGPILLFYTPRSLVKPLIKEDESYDELSDKPLSYLASSEESPHRGFRVLENSHGTFMFHPKHHGLLEEISELKNWGLGAIRLELLNGDKREIIPLISKIIKGEDEALKARAVYGHQLIKGFYKVNKSNVLFKKLKNDRLTGRDENFLGIVLDYKKGRALAVHNLHSTRALKVGETLKFLNPEGREKMVTLTGIKDLSGEDVPLLEAGKVGLIPHVGAMSVKSQIFWTTTLS